MAGNLRLGTVVVLIVHMLHVFNTLSTLESFQFRLNFFKIERHWIKMIVSRRVLCVSRPARSSWMPRTAVQRRFIALHSHTHHATALSTIQSNIDNSSDEFKSNAKAMQDTISTLQQHHKRIQLGGSTKARDKHVARGKMLPRE
jgi:hypothetical protein